jgi:hypothetical protein
VQQASVFGAQSVIAHGHFNSDPYEDIAVAVSIGSTSVSNAYDYSGVYIILGTPSGTIDLVRDADVVISGFGGPIDLANSGDVNGDGIDDLLVGVVACPTRQAAPTSIMAAIIGTAQLWCGRILKTQTAMHQTMA